MASIGEAIRNLLTADSPPAIATPVYATQAPQSARGPMVVYQQLSRAGWDHLTGPSGMVQATVQIDSYAAGYAAAQALADRIRRRLDGFRGLVAVGSDSPPDTIRIGAIRLANQFDLFEGEPDPKTHRVTQEFLVTFEEEISS